MQGANSRGGRFGEMPFPGLALNLGVKPAFERTMWLQSGRRMTMVEYSHPGNRMRAGEKMSTAKAAEALGVSKPTLLRWFRQRKIDEVGRDRNGWRVFTAADIRRIKRAMGIAA